MELTSGLIQDIRSALRAVRREPAFSAFAALIVGLGGGSAAGVVRLRLHLRTGLLGREAAAEDRLDAQHREQVVSHLGAADALGAAVRREVEGRGIDQGRSSPRTVRARAVILVSFSGVSGGNPSVGR
jgi:hypothetical protein